MEEQEKLQDEQQELSDMQERCWTSYTTRRDESKRCRTCKVDCKTSRREWETSKRGKRTTKRAVSQVDKAFADLAVMRD